MKIFVTGSTGQMGQTLKGLLPELNYIDRKKLDLSFPDRVAPFFRKNPADMIVNFSAYTNVETAEDERELAFKVNAQSVKELAKSCRQLIHVSTDFVYDGQKCTPYVEADPVGPVNYYGVTKLEGERAAVAANPNTMIFRTSLIYSAIGTNFIKRALELAVSRPKLAFVDDVTCSPTLAKDLAGVIQSIVQDADRFQPGIFNYSDEGVCSRYDIVKAVCRLNNLKVEVLPTQSSAVPSKAKRPSYTVLDKTKIKKSLGITIPNWYDNLIDFFNNQI